MRLKRNGDDDKIEDAEIVANVEDDPHPERYIRTKELMIMIESADTPEEIDRVRSLNNERKASSHEKAAVMQAMASKDKALRIRAIEEDSSNE